MSDLAFVETFGLWKYTQILSSFLQNMCTDRSDRLSLLSVHIFCKKTDRHNDYTVVIEL